MTNRITDKHLQAVIDRINRITGSPMEYMTVTDGKRVINIGHYHISGAYGGVCLHRTMNDSGGVNCPIGQCHVPKRDLYERMHAFIAGLESAK